MLPSFAMVCSRRSYAGPKEMGKGKKGRQRERERETVFSFNGLRDPNAHHSIKQLVVGRAKGLRVGDADP